MVYYVPKKHQEKSLLLPESKTENKIRTGAKEEDQQRKKTQGKREARVQIIENQEFHDMTKAKRKKKKKLSHVEGRKET